MNRGVREGPLEPESRQTEELPPSSNDGLGLVTAKGALSENHRPVLAGATPDDPPISSRDTPVSETLLAPLVQIRDAENRAAERVRMARLEAKRIVARAREQGEANRNQLRERAEREAEAHCAQLVAQADAALLRLDHETAHQIERVQAQAEDRLPVAVNVVIEELVS